MTKPVPLKSINIERTLALVEIHMSDMYNGGNTLTDDPSKDMLFIYEQLLQDIYGPGILQKIRELREKNERKRAINS